MKKIVTVNVAGIAFSLDEDAYTLLSNYLSDIEYRLFAQHDYSETMQDIEIRVMELFKESDASESVVVDVALVRRVIATIGNPSVFGERTTQQGSAQSSDTSGEYNYVTTKLMRSPKNNYLGGVCGGLAAYWQLDVSIVRVLTLALAIFWGVSIWIYIVLWIILPMAKTPEEINMQNRGHRGSSNK